MEVASVPVGPLTLSVLEAGRGGRPLLLVHGFTGAKEDFADYLDAFAAEGWWVVAPDLRGHGASDQPGDEAAYSLASFAADLVALVDHLGWKRFALLGHSMGGMIAQELVLDHTQRVDRLVLMDTHHGAVEGIDKDLVALAIGVLRSEGLPALLAVIASMPRAQRTPSEIRLRATRDGYAEWSDGKVRNCAGAMYAAMAQELPTRRDRLAELAVLPVPTRVVVGAEDAGFLPASRRMGEAMASADLVVIPDASHCPQFEHPTAWWDAVASFLADRSSAA